MSMSKGGQSVAFVVSDKNFKNAVCYHDFII
jgi:hypothetical protein